LKLLGDWQGCELSKISPQQEFGVFLIPLTQGPLPFVSGIVGSKSAFT
jgi:hypothetical protein